MCKRVERICQVDPDGWYAPVVGEELVRCRDCKNRYSSCPMITIHPTGTITFRAQDDWFCFMGEKEE